MIPVESFSFVMHDLQILLYTRRSPIQRIRNPVAF